MLIKSCFHCNFHEISQVDEEKISRCLKENCYAQYSKCVFKKALGRFLREEGMSRERPFSALEHFYPGE